MAAGKSTHLDKFVMGVLNVLQMGLPGGGLMFLGILVKKYMLPGLASWITSISAMLLSMTLLEGVRSSLYVVTEKPLSAVKGSFW